MQKLTEEQAEDVMQKVCEGKIGMCCLGIVQKAVNQCTEKEFPEYKAKHINIFLDHNDEVRISIEGQELEFTNKQFKEFTDGCNKIVEWLHDAN